MLSHPAWDALYPAALAALLYAALRLDLVPPAAESIVRLAGLGLGGIAAVLLVLRLLGL